METILITGSSRRLGAMIAEDLAASGDFIWIHYRTGKEQAETLKRKITATGGMAECVQADLTDPAQIDSMLETIAVSPFGKLTTLINNASIFVPGKLNDTSPDDWDKLMNTNLKAVWYLSSRFSEVFSSAVRIITIGDASVSGLMTEHAVYGLGKYALKYLTKQMAVSYAQKIRVNMISPGLVMKGESESDEVWNSRCSRTLFDNEAICGQILSAVRFLMADPGMTGSELLIDNGLRFYSKMNL